jgi:hypothetical protein
MDSGFELPKWLEIALLAALAASFLPGITGMFGRNATVVLSTPFFLLGLAVIHTLSRRIAARSIALVVLYFLLIVAMLPVGALVALLGLVEHWNSLRRRFPAPGGGTQEKK